MKKIAFLFVIYYLFGNSGFLLSETFLENQETYHLHTVFSSPQLQKTFGSFLSHVLKQNSPEDCYAIINQLIDKQHPHHDRSLYNALLQKRKDLRPLFSFYTQLKTLFEQKELLSNQASTLLESYSTLEGCVEIGTPGTYASALQKIKPFKGPLYVVNDKKSWQDPLQAFSYNLFKGCTAYDYFVPLINYEPLCGEIPDSSVDIVICFIGLHHIPSEKIIPFITSIHRVLRPGGILLLREHDCYDQTMESIIFTAHSMYNILISNTSLEDEQAEIRNFHPLDYWISLLKSQGFKASSERLVQENDPTVNTMVIFVKETQTEDEQLQAISRQLKDDPSYQIDATQTYLTSPEWVNVDASQEYASFIEHTPFYKFPYLKQIDTYWQVFKHSWKTARKKQSAFKLATSSYTLMNLFVGIFMSIEYGAKALISWPIGNLYQDGKPTPIKLLVKDPRNQLGNVDSRITIVKEYPESSFVLIAMPRNKEFLAIIEKLNSTDITLEEIAGQKEIQIKVKGTPQDILFIDQSGCTVEYSWQIPTDPAFMYAALTIEIHHLKEIFKQLAAQNIAIVHIHDF